MIPLVRVGENNANLIKRVMDAGAYGVIIPNVTSTDEVKNAINAVKYPLEGTRGVGLYRAQGYGKLFNEYFSNDNHKMQIVRPFEVLNQATEYDVRCSVKGGGHTGQAGAMVHGISKALLLFDQEFKPALRKEKLTTRDSRAVERKKPGRKKARRSFQFSKR